MSRYTLREEKANTFTHAIGIPFGLAVTYFLMQKTIPTNNYWLICSTLVYAVFMTFSYVTSTLYHSDKDENRKLLRRKFDHAAIYVHIAGTYTPFTLEFYGYSKLFVLKISYFFCFYFCFCAQS